MKRKDDFEIIDVSNEYMAIPVGEKAKDFYGMVILSEPAAFLLKHMDHHMTEDELVELLLQEYEVEPSVATADIQRIIDILLDIGLIEE